MTTVTLTLTEFLLARIAEDEDQAREAISERDRIDWTHPPEIPDLNLRAWPDAAVPAVLVGPERVLAECEAKRRIVAMLDPWTCKPDAAPGAVGCRDDTVLGYLAAVYADHPDYRDEWAV